MKKLFLLFALIGFSWISQAQIKDILKPTGGLSNGRFTENDSIPDKFIAVKILGKTHFKDYKIISHLKDTTYIDTTLTIQKEYKHNFRLKDNFELMPFGNMGQTFNRLGYNFNNVPIFPLLGATAKRFDFYAVEDVKYYRVPTPTTIFTHKTGFQQGQMLNTLLTMNTSERLNFSLAFKGLRSLGFYRNELSSHGNFTFTINYRTANDKYSIRGHMVAQDLLNNENGGIIDSAIEDFENGNPQFTQRSRIDVNLEDATSVLRANRYYFEQDYKLWQKKDTLTNTTSHLRVGHVLNYQLEHYEFDQSFADSFFGDASGVIKDKLAYKKTYNQLFVALKAPIVLGEVAFKIEDYNYDYEHLPDSTNTNLSSVGLKGNTVAIGGTWKAQLKRFYLNVDASNSVTGPLSGNRLKAEAILKKDSVYTISAGVLIASKSPNFNYLLYQSAYDAYNWQNDFKNERFKNIHFSAKVTSYGSIEAQFTTIDNYTYFGLPDATTLQTKSEQASESVSYFKIKVSKEFKKGKFSLNNTIMFNNVSSGSTVFRVPSFVTRNTLYYSNYFFEGKPLFLQMGVTLKYFSEYYANSFNPLLNEFSLQNETKIGAFPMIDFFMNAQIQRTRIFLKVEHLNSGFTGYNFYSAPNYPFRDLSVRFGLVWNFFI